MCGCCSGYCTKCSAMQAIVVGALVLANSFWNVVSWAQFVGYLLVLAGALKLIMPSCPCNKGGCAEGMCSSEMPKMAKKKK